MTVATTYSDIGQRTTVWAEGKMLEHAEPILVLDKFGDVKPLPKNKADTIKFRRPVPYVVTTTQLIEGVTPAPKSITYEDVSVQMGQYGDLFEMSDKVADMSEDPVLANATMLLGEQAAETKELILWGVLRAGTNVFYSGTSATARTDVDNTITLALQRAVVRSLKQQRAKTITSMVSASPKFGTEAVAPAFVCFGHTDCEQDIRDMDGFTPVERYGNFSPISPYEVGKVEGVRYILSPVLVPFADAGGTAATNGMVSTSGTSADVYPLVYIAKNAYGTVPLKGAGSMNPIVINPGKPSPSDPLGQRGYVGWKMYFAATILNEAWIARVEVGVTDLA